MRALGIATLALIALGAPAPSAAPAAGQSPRHMVAFVAAGTCPSGWQVDTLTAGRLLVGTDQPAAIGRVVGTPLADQEDRAHGHALTSATVALPHKSISAGNGGNDQGAASGDRPLGGTVTASPSGLPFVQLTACLSP